MGRGLVVLSLCDGMSTGQAALESAGVKVAEYYASEIDECAIKIATQNYPKTREIGDMTKIEWLGDEKILRTEKGDYWLPHGIDLILSGTPCQSFSIAGKKENMEGVSGELFYEFVRILNTVMPKYFLFENVRMREDIADIIDAILGVKRVFLNSVEFNGHIRKRYYWTNIPLGNREIRDIYLKDIIDKSIPYERDCEELLDRTVYAPTTSKDGIITINPTDKQGKQTWQRGRIYDITGKCPTICASLFDLCITEDHKKYRKLTIEECEKLQGLKPGYTAGVPYTQRGKMLGNGWQKDTIAYILKGLNK